MNKTKKGNGSRKNRLTVWRWFFIVISLLGVIALILLIPPLNKDFLGFLHLDNRGEPTVMRGVLTEIAHDCARPKVLAANGTIVEEQGVAICDAGDSIQVNGVRIYTSSGNVMSDSERYNTDLSSLQPGDNVEVRYMKYDNSANTACSTCYVKKL